MKHDEPGGDFNGFYRARVERTVRQVALMTGSVHGAEDVTHDAMLEVFRRWDTLTNPGAYLYRVAANGAMAWSRRSRRAHSEVLDRGVEAPSTAFVEVAELLGRLTARQRAAIVLRYYEDLTEAQIADALGCRPGTVGPLLARARATLRKELAS